MRAVGADEIQEGFEWVCAASNEQLGELMMQMMNEQPYLQVYLAAVCEGDLESEDDQNAFVNLGAVIWRTMRNASEDRLSEVHGNEIEEREGNLIKFMEYAEGEKEPDLPKLVELWMKDVNQRSIFNFLVDKIMSEENPFNVTAMGGGLIFMHLKVLIDCLDNAEVGK